MSTLAAGSRLGSYEILAPLGAGGMGHVFLAYDERLQRKVAIKVLSDERHLDTDSLTRFAQEARSASALNHPNIVTIHEIGLEGAAPYIVMEYIEGRSLREILSEGQSLRRILQIATQMAEGLAAAHERRIVHRDLKPENVMVNRDGLVKIVDFGLAKVHDLGGEDEETFELKSPPTSPGTVVGTIGYMSPEQANGLSLDYRSDQFSFGSILYEMATGRRPFRRATALDTLSAIVHEEPEPIERINPKVPPPYRWVVERCLSKSPEDRYASTVDLARELRTLRDRLAETSASSGEILVGAARKRPQFLTPAVAAAAAASLLVVAFLGLSRLHRTAAPTQNGPRSIAVIPFQDLDNSQQALGAGLAESISTRLSRLDGLQVVPTDKTVHSKSAVVSGADLIVRGAIQHSGQEIRITYSLIGPDGRQLAADSVSGAASTLFSLQDRVADGVANALTIATARQTKTAVPASLAEDHYLQAIGYLQRYQDAAAVSEAIRLLEDLQKTSPSARGTAALGRAYLARFQLTHEPEWADRAIDAAGRATAGDDNSADVQLSAGQIALQTGNYDEATARFRRALAIKPDYADAILGFAEARELSGALEEAERNYKRAITLRPNYWAGYNKLGVFYLLHGRISESIPLFKRVIALNPDNVRGYNNLGAALEQSGQYRQAISVFEESSRRQEGVTAFSNIGTCRYLIGDFGAAAAAFERATALSPENFILWANLGDALRWTPGAQPRSSAAYERAITLAHRELTLNDKNVNARAILAVCLARTGKLDLAEKEIATARSGDPASGSLAYYAAIISAVGGDAKQVALRLQQASKMGYDIREADHEPEFARTGRTQVEPASPSQQKG